MLPALVASPQCGFKIQLLTLGSGDSRQAIATDTVPEEFCPNFVVRAGK